MYFRYSSPGGLQHLSFFSFSKVGASFLHRKLMDVSFPHMRRQLLRAVASELWLAGQQGCSLQSPLTLRPSLLALFFLLSQSLLQKTSCQATPCLVMCLSPSYRAFPPVTTPLFQLQHLSSSYSTPLTVTEPLPQL